MKACKHCIRYYKGMCIKAGFSGMVIVGPEKQKLDICPSWKVRHHSRTSNAICPYCGNRDRASYQFDLKDGQTKEYTCNHCKKLYAVTAHITTTYTTGTE
jgi:hypothetical protein